MLFLTRWEFPIPLLPVLFQVFKSFNMEYLPNAFGSTLLVRCSSEVMVLAGGL